MIINANRIDGREPLKEDYSLDFKSVKDKALYILAMFPYPS